MNLFITNIELNYDKELLLKEFDSAELIPYTPSRPIRGESWFSHQPDWLTLTVEDFTNFPEVKKIYDYISSIYQFCLLYTSPSPRDKRQSRMPSSA